MMRLRVLLLYVLCNLPLLLATTRFVALQSGITGATQPSFPDFMSRRLWLMIHHDHRSIDEQARPHSHRQYFTDSLRPKSDEGPGPFDLKFYSGTELIERIELDITFRREGHMTLEAQIAMYDALKKGPTRFNYSSNYMLVVQQTYRGFPCQEIARLTITPRGQDPDFNIGTVERLEQNRETFLIALAVRGEEAERLKPGRLRRMVAEPVEAERWEARPQEARPSSPETLDEILSKPSSSRSSASGSSTECDSSYSAQSPRGFGMTEFGDEIVPGPPASQIVPNYIPRQCPMEIDFARRSYPPASGVSNGHDHKQQKGKVSLVSDVPLLGILHQAAAYDKQSTLSSQGQAHINCWSCDFSNSQLLAELRPEMTGFNINIDELAPQARDEQEPLYKQR
ncbi:MAG: hypothetical protein M1837_003029 [Sclerophora amabilis]|nr:MAG: hypothetical protein M1837_003029 [Sclerophora amabilis]